MLLAQPAQEDQNSVRRMLTTYDEVASPATEIGRRLPVVTSLLCCSGDVVNGPVIKRVPPR